MAIYKKILLFSTLPLAIFFLFLFLIPSSKNVFPGNIKTQIYSDTTYTEGNTKVNYFNISPNKIEFSFTLKDGYSSPYAGFSIILKDSIGTFANISNYDYVCLRFSPKSTSNKARVYLKSFVEGFTDTSNYITYRFFEYETSYQNNLIALSNFYTPQWWYSVNKKSHMDFEKENFDKIYSIEIARSSVTPIGETVELIIEEIIFIKERNYFYLFIAIFIFVMNIIFLVKTKKNENISNDIDYKKIDIKNSSDEIWDEIESYLQLNFTEFDVTIETISGSTGVSKNKIGSTIKDKTGMSFRNFLNRLRIEEVQKTLSGKKDIQIIDAAYSAGFSSISNFNRKFKEITGVTPKEFRNKN